MGQYCFHGFVEAESELDECVTGVNDIRVSQERDRIFCVLEVLAEILKSLDR